MTYDFFFILDRPWWPHIMIMIGWWCSKPRTEATGTLGYVPILCFFTIVVLLPSAPAWRLFLRRYLSTFILLSFRLRCRSLPCLLYINNLLLPSPPRKPSSRPPNISFTEVQNWPHRNILRDCVLPPCDVYPDLLKYHFLHSFHQRRIFPSTLPPPPSLPPGETSNNPVLEASQGPLHPGDQKPCL